MSGEGSSRDLNQRFSLQTASPSQKVARITEEARARERREEEEAANAGKKKNKKAKKREQEEQENRCVEAVSHDDADLPCIRGERTGRGGLSHWFQPSFTHLAGGWHWCRSYFRTAVV